MRVKFKCFDPTNQLDTGRFVGTVIMSYVLDNGALFLFFLDDPQGHGMIVGVAGVEVNSTTYISWGDALMIGRSTSLRMGVLSGLLME